MTMQPVAAPRRNRLRIAVLTFRRLDEITTCISQLAHQASQVADHGWDVDMLVVDNDPDAGATDVVGRAAAGAPVAVEYRHEPTPGIAAARNRALTESTAIDVLIFFDDDELPCDGWLSHLLSAHVRYRCAVVGPVVSKFAGELDPWITAGRFFERLRVPTGTPVAVAATNNLLLDMHVVRELGLEFDQVFGLSGGSDTLFTRELHRKGGRMVACDEAIAYDMVPAHRATRRWVIQRALRSGNGWSATSRALAQSTGERLHGQARDAMSGVTRLGGGVAQFVSGLLTDNLALRARGSRTLARGAGLLSGAFGYRYFEYKRK